MYSLFQAVQLPKLLLITVIQFLHIIFYLLPLLFGTGVWPIEMANKG